MIGAIAFQILGTWNDFAIPIGLDHRCVHCILHLPVVRFRHNSDRRRGLRHWVPYFGRERTPGLFQSVLRQRISTCSHLSVEDIKIALMEAGLERGTCSNIRFKYQPPAALRQLRKHRRHATNPETRRVLSFQLRRQQLRELQTWKSMEHLRDSSMSMWSALRKMDGENVCTRTSP